MATPRSITPPNLPLSPQSYDRMVQDQYTNVIRLHFTLQDNSINQLIDAVNSAVTLQWLGDLS